MSPQFLLFVVDRLLGGVGETDVQPREISQIEQNVVSRIIQTIINQLNEVWKQIFPLEATLDGFESDPQFIQIARSSDTLVIIFLDIRVRGATFTMNIAFPYFALEPIISRLTAQSMIALTTRRLKPGEGEIVRDKIRATKLPLQVILAQTTMKVRDFINLERDDLLQIEKRTADPLPVLVGGKLKYLGTPGKLGRRKAVKIIRPVTPEENQYYE
jgi:flagellar motor switch protein FliM